MDLGHIQKSQYTPKLPLFIFVSTDTNLRFFLFFTEYKKHHPPSWDDELWRLEKIKKDGPFLKKFNDNGIFKVEDFLRFLVRDSQALRKVGTGLVIE